VLTNCGTPVWDVVAVRAIVADQSHPLTFFCGGSRNFTRFIELFDGVFVLDVDAETLRRRLAARSEDPVSGRGPSLVCCPGVPVLRQGFSQRTEPLPHPGTDDHPPP
jgi:hypothetical protein